MAQINILNYLSLGADTPLIATSYQIALDQNFTQIVDEIHQTEEYKLSWSSPLPKINSTGFYSDEEKLYARIRLFLKDENGDMYAPDDWYYIPMMSQVDYNKEHEIITGDSV